MAQLPTISASSASGAVADLARRDWDRDRRRAGHNGLAAAAYSRRGQRVLVLERASARRRLHARAPVRRPTFSASPRVLVGLLDRSSSTSSG